MPFTLQVLETRRDGNELLVRGRVMTGAYFGPEAAVVRSRAGEELPTQIHSHAMEYLEGWPVVPEHRKTILILRISSPPPGFQVATLLGLGALARFDLRSGPRAVAWNPQWVASECGERNRYPRSSRDTGDRDGHGGSDDLAYLARMDHSRQRRSL